MLIRSWMELKRSLKMQNKQILVQFAAKAAVCEQKLPKNTADNLDLIHDKINPPEKRENKYIKLVNHFFTHIFVDSQYDTVVNHQSFLSAQQQERV